MTTTPTLGRTPAGIAWGPVAWISVLRLKALLALVTAFFRWDTALVCVWLPTRDRSTNNGWVGLLAHGEGWHNNHHAFPTSTRHGRCWWELDMTYLAIRLLQAVRLVHTRWLPKPTPAPGSTIVTIPEIRIQGAASSA